MTDLYPVTIEDMVTEVRRECAMRRRVYGDATRHGRMNRRQADRQIDVMDAVLTFLEKHQNPDSDTARIAELEHTFDLMWEADTRAIKRWQDAHPGNDHVLPDRAKLTGWLLDQIDLHKESKAL